MLQPSNFWKRVSRGLPKGGRILAAVSGGADSVALLHLVLPPPDERNRLLIGHIHHGTGQFADDSCDFVRGLADALNLRFECRMVDVPADERKRFGFEASARFHRYQALESIAKENNCLRLLTAHTLDDKAEGFLLSAMRGAGMAGLSSVRSSRGEVIRPLIRIRRQELRDFLRSQGIEWMEDPANEDPAYTRVAIRQHLQPVIEQEFGTGAWRNLARSAEFAERAVLTLDGIAEQAFRKVAIRSTPRWISVDAKALLGYFPDVRDRVLIRAWCHAAECDLRGQYLKHSERLHLAAALKAKNGDRILVRDVAIRRKGDRLVFDGLEKLAPQPLILPGKTALCDGGQVSVEIVPATESVRRLSVPGRVELLDADTLGSVVSLRAWQEGDRFIPLGRTRHLKVARTLRRKPSERIGGLWVLLAQDGRIALVLGERIAEPFKLQESTRQVAVVTYSAPMAG